MSTEKDNISSYEQESWQGYLGSRSVERHKFEDYSASYEMECAHVLELESGKFAFVHESGCSCYSSSDASIDVVDTKAEAMRLFDRWEADQRRYRGGDTT